MDKRQIKKRLEKTGIAFSMILFCCFCVLRPAYAKEREQQVIKVGYYPVANYQDSAEDGSYSGFSYDYYMQIQKYTGWKYEFVEASYSDCINLLMNGEIDIMSGLMKTEDREEQMLFSKTSVSNTQNKLYTRGNQQIHYEDYEGFDGCNVAVLMGSVQEGLLEYAREHHFTVNLIAYDTMSEMEKALLSGEADMLFATSVSSGIDTKIVDRLDKKPLYYAVTKNRPEVMDELNDALKKIIDNNPNFYTQMSEKYMIDGANATATFTKEELEFIHTQEPIYIILNHDWAPISWYDEAQKAYRGIVVDVLEGIKEYSGLDFIYCDEEEFQELAEENPELINSVLAILADDNTWAVSQNVMMTNHIVDESVVIVTKRSAHQTQISKDMKITLPKGFYIS